MKTKLLFLLVFFSAKFFAQPTNDTIIFTERGHYFYTIPNALTFYAVYSPLIDRMGRQFVYTASEELGMITFDMNNQNQPVPVDTIQPSALNNEYASSLAQDSVYLFVGKGVFQSSGQRAGLAIFDMTNPVAPVLLDQWDSAAFTHGTAQVVLQGNYAYLAAMDDGLIILDISNKQNIRFVSHIVPTTLPNMSGVHARGIFVSNNTVLIAYDGGGLRVIDVSNINAPVQTGAYLNAAACQGGNKPYYNHVWRAGNQAFVPIDYRGIEVDDVTNPANISTLGWNNIWNNTTLGNWNGSDGHANEICSAAPTANVLMMSGGDSQVLAVDLGIFSPPRIAGEWGVPNLDSLGSWGVDVFGNTVALGIMRTPFPFYSDSGGLQLLNYNFILSVRENQMQIGTLKLFPNPTSSSCTIELPISSDKLFTIEVIDVMGRIVKTETADPKLNGRQVEIDLANFSSGVYTIRVSSESTMYSGRVLRE